MPAATATPVEHHHCHDPYVLPGSEWREDEFARPLLTPPVAGPFQFPEDAELIRWCLCFIIHARAMQRVYAALEDPKQRQRWFEAEVVFLDALGRTFPVTTPRLPALADEVVSAAPITGTPGQEIGWSSHGLTVIRKLEIGWRHAKAPRLAGVVRARRLVVRAIRCSLPDSWATSLLAEELCAWSVDGTSPDE